MKFGMRERLRWLKIRVLGPFQRIGHKLKYAAQRFVIKTVEKHSNVNASISNSSDAATVGLLLSVLGARRKSEVFQTPLLQTIPIKDYLLTSHPRVDFFYHRPLDLAETPWMLKGNYESSVSAWICSNICREDRVLILGGGQGYHALSVAKQLESEGQLLVLARPSEDQEVFELNFRTNRLTAFVQLQLVQIDDNAILSKELCDAIHRFAPSKILVDHRQCVDLDLAIMNGFEFSKVFVVECGEVTHYYKDSCIERSLLTWKVA